MRAISELIAAGPTVSFEFFPPSTDAGRAQLTACLDDIASIHPSFVSVTYGAGGSTRDNTRGLVIEINEQRGYPAMPHLTCIGHRREELTSMLDAYAAADITNILALAGDPPADGSPADGDFSYASELVQLIRSRGTACVGVAAFPEGHPRSPSIAHDREQLAAKLEVADFGIAQFFYRAADYFRMRDDLAALGCTKPVLPGIMPMLNPDTVRRFAAMNGAYFPEELAQSISDADPADRLSRAVDAAQSLIDELRREAVPGIHVYCLNRSDVAVGVMGSNP